MQQNPSPYRLTFTLQEASAITGISVYLLKGMVQRGELTCLRVGTRWFIPRVVLEEMLGEKIEITR